MKRVTALIIAICGFALVSPVLAQSGAGGGGGPESGGGSGPGASPIRSLRKASMGRGAVAGMLTNLYDPKTVTTIKGAVESLETLPPKVGGVPQAIRNAVLKTDQGNINVYLCPDFFLNQQKISLKVGDQLEATGSKVTLKEQPALIAKEFKVGDKTLVIRNDQGFSLWPVSRSLRRSPLR